jgi:tetratricopeptide (TPR) repeat protein
MATLFAGEARTAAAALAHGLELNRHDPQNFVWYTLLALALLFDGRPQEALQCAVAALQVRPTWRAAMVAAAAASAAAGRADAATQWRRQASQLPPAAGDALQPLWRCNPQWLQQIDRFPTIGPSTPDETP